jgi:transcriptional regulator
MISHVPFVLNANGTEAELHLVRSNPIARAVTGPTQAVLAVTGPDGYVSPDWYDTPDQVPTWNYVAVHLRGHSAPPTRQPPRTISTPYPPISRTACRKPPGPPTR